MPTSTDPRYVVGQVLTLLGIGGGNARALANAPVILDDRQQTHEQVDALETRLQRVAPNGLRVGWPVSPRTGQPRSRHTSGLQADIGAKGSLRRRGMGDAVPYRKRNHFEPRVAPELGQHTLNM
jgi:hypothetical protein